MDLDGLFEREVPNAPSLERRVHGFLHARVHAGRGKAGHGERMKVGSLWTLRNSIFSLLKDFGGLSEDERADWSCKFKAWTEAFIIKYDLKNDKPETVLFGVQEVRMLIKEALDNPASWEGALQYCFAVLLSLYTGVRLGTLFLTRGHSSFLRNKHVVFRWELREGGWCWTVIIMFTVFKGYQDGMLHVSYTIRCPEDARNLFGYLEAYGLALGFRQEDFVTESLETALKDGGEIELKWKDPEALFFHAMKSRSEVDVEAMNDRQFLEKHHLIARRCGLDGDKEAYSTTLYSFRKVYATRMLQAKGADWARGSMGHQYNTGVLFESYDDGNWRLDFFAVAFEGEGSEGDKSNLMHAADGPAAYMERTPPVVPLTMEGMVGKDPMIAVRMKEIANLELLLGEGGDMEGWEELMHASTINIVDMGVEIAKIPVPTDDCSPPPVCVRELTCDDELEPPAKGNLANGAEEMIRCPATNRRKKYLCRLCEEEGVGEYSGKDWKFPVKLDCHMNSKYHSAEKRAKRYLEALNAQLESKRWRCPWCNVMNDREGSADEAEARQPPTKTFRGAGLLIAHILAEHERALTPHISALLFECRLGGTEVDPVTALKCPECAAALPGSTRAEKVWSRLDHLQNHRHMVHQVCEDEEDEVDDDLEPRGFAVALGDIGGMIRGTMDDGAGDPWENTMGVWGDVEMCDVWGTEVGSGCLRESDPWGEMSVNRG
ncbi:hypothetical protein DFH07DRAFT_963505 [Mycena maculata]|uniref:Uncharacterized protein n=1 Tax=Mycena maculata TaxID=230809 RepID=A0AAD7N4A7_9AGAR|nr:hypothetical protein DFH07DRAFT_963505 [Mycena maculata]